MSIAIEYAEREIKPKEYDIKNYVFEVLPQGSGQWIIIAWGKIINDQTGSFKQEIVLRRFSDKDDPSKTWNIRDRSKLFYCIVDLGSIKVLSPGTIIEDQKIKCHIEEYLKKREIVIDNPQGLEKKPFRCLYDPTFPQWEREITSSSVDKIETRIFNDPLLGQVTIPCSVIADYYYFGRVHLVKAVLEGMLDVRFRNRNDVFNPHSLEQRMSPNGKVVVVIELHRRMDFEDQTKIARLAIDDYFRGKCLDIATGIIGRKTEESFVNTDLPVKESTTLSVYGVQIIGKGGCFFLVHSIAMCSVKPPFDLIIADKNFRPKIRRKDDNQSDDGLGEENQSDDGTSSFDDTDDSKDKLELTPSRKNNSRKKKSITHLQDGGKKNIGPGIPRWDSVSKELNYARDQADNFLDGDAIRQIDFEDPSKKEKIDEILARYKISIGQSTNPDKKGSADFLQIKMSALKSGKPKPPPPTTAFQIIENFVDKFISLLMQLENEVITRIRCPIPEGDDKYSIFWINDFVFDEKGASKKMYKDFCFLNVRLKGHSHHRRIFIKEISINQHIFYVMDVEPKYRAAGKDKMPSKYISACGVIFYAGTSILNDEKLKGILKSIVLLNKASIGRWEFLKEEPYEYQFQLIRHRQGDRSYDSVSTFIWKFIY